MQYAKPLKLVLAKRVLALGLKEERFDEARQSLIRRSALSTSRFISSLSFPNRFDRLLTHHLQGMVVDRATIRVPFTFHA